MKIKARISNKYWLAIMILINVSVVIDMECGNTIQ